MNRFFPVLLLALLGGCNLFQVFQPDSKRIQTKTWARHGGRSELDHVYCYRTLGDPQCYREKQKGREHLLLNNQRAPVDEREVDAFYIFNLQDPTT